MLYEYRCAHCGREDEKHNTIAERKTNAPDCCGAKMEQHFRTPPRAVYVQAWDDNYKCVATGEVVTSRRKRAEVMARHDLVDGNDFPPPTAEQDSAHKAEVKRQREMLEAATI